MTAPRTNNGKPHYDRSLGAYQQAFRSELATIVEQLPLTAQARVLDVPCGNGFYARLLADRLQRAGRLVCVDLCPAYLRSTRRRLRGASAEWATRRADAYHLSFADVSAEDQKAYHRFANSARSTSVFGAKAMDLTCLNVLYLASKGR